MNAMKGLFVAGLLGLLAGCATPQPPVALDQQFYSQNEKSVGLMLEVPEKPSLALEGNIGLLDYAIIAAATSDLTKHIESQDLGEFVAISEQLKAQLEQEGLSLEELEVPAEAPKLEKFKDPDTKDTTYFAAKDYRGMSEEHGVDYLLRLTATHAGLSRPYYGFVPTDAPRAEFLVHGELIDLSNNQLLWYANISRSGYASGEWDEGPSFPGLTNTYYVVMNKAREDVLQALAKRDPATATLALKEGGDEEAASDSQ